ncbi:hypothetical protein BGZ94_009641 [Podila epigama]|nr:hypothetical protein BGZ94_009641 [Podila epigama]
MSHSLTGQELGKSTNSDGGNRSLSPSATSSTIPIPSPSSTAAFTEIAFASPSKSFRKLSLQTYLAALPEWSSPSRLASLFSDFHRLKETNPYGYETNVNWWRTVIIGAARSGHFSMYQSYVSTSLPKHHAQALTYSRHYSDGSESHQEKYESTGAAIGILELDMEYVISKLHKDGMKPLSIPTVMNEMSRTGELVLWSDFLPWAGVGWTEWIFHMVVSTPLLWSLKQLSLSDTRSPKYTSTPTLASTHLGYAGTGSPGSLSGGNLSSGALGRSAGKNMASPVLSSNRGHSPVMSQAGYSQESYVILPFVQEASANIVAMQQEIVNYHVSDNLMTFVDFRQKFSRTALKPVRGKFSSGDGSGVTLVLTDRDLEILLRYLQFEMKVLVVGALNPEDVIKFATKDAAKDKLKLQITDVDRGIIGLRATSKRLENQVQDIEDRIAELTEKARICVSKGQRSQAAFSLRQRKNLEEVLNKRLKYLETMGTILLRIQSSETDAEILHAYKLGSNTLASVMATKDQDGKQILSQNNVESTMDHLTEVLADQQEVDQAMSLGTDMFMETSVASGMDEDQLMAELDALAEQSKTTDHIQPVEHSPKDMQIEQQFPEQVEKVKSVEQLATELPSVPTWNPEQPTSPITSTESSQRQLLTTAPAGKRAAEVPEQDSAKQRKVSQASAQSHRRNSAESKVAQPA